jgi:excisionase family DNA binding protein
VKTERMWYTTETAAQELSMSVRMVRLRVASGELPGRKLGRRWYVHRDTLRAYVNRKRAA